jgi:hypothetical protein
MQDSHRQRKFVWIAIVYVAVIVLVSCPALHEQLGVKLLLWNYIPPTLGLLVIATAFDKSRPRMVVSITFALVTAIVTTFFSIVWFLTPLDLDPHSGTTRLVFIFAPVFSFGLATISSGVAWLVARAR